jgi:cytoskeletal protein CcmA (bactofilin family)
MFGSSTNNNNKREATKSNGTPATHSLNSLVQGTVIEGTVTSESDIRIDGTIKGKLFCNAKVIIGPAGTIEGEIKCKNAVIEGKFQGTLEVAELLNVREMASVSGDVRTNKLIVQSGAVFSVNCTMGGVKQLQLNSLNTLNIAKEEKTILKAAN